MKQIIMLLLASIFIFGLFIGCSDEKKEEAAKMEQELLADSQNYTDSTELIDSTADLTTDTEFEAEAIPEEEPVKEMPKQPAGDGFTVQIAGCEDRAYAEHLVEKYTKRGYEPFVTTITVEGQTYYRVRVGLFDNISEAKSLQADLYDKYSLDTWIDVTKAEF